MTQNAIHHTVNHHRDNVEFLYFETISARIVQKQESAQTPLSMNHITDFDGNDTGNKQFSRMKKTSPHNRYHIRYLFDNVIVFIYDNAPKPQQKSIQTIDMIALHHHMMIAYHVICLWEYGNVRTILFYYVDDIPYFHKTKNITTYIYIQHQQ